MLRFVSESDWSLIPGPEDFKEPLNSQELHEIAEYEPEVVAGALLTIPGIKLLHDAEPSWWQWRARWNKDNRFIEFEMTLFDTVPVTWGGFGLTADCEVKDIVEIWSRLQEKLAGVWLHSPTCRVYKPESFSASLPGS